MPPRTPCDWNRDRASGKSPTLFQPSHHGRRVAVAEPHGGSKRTLLAIEHPVADPRLGENERGFGGIGFELLAQLADEDAQVLIVGGMR